MNNSYLFDIKEELKGRLERITYSNEENGYTVAKLKVTDFRIWLRLRENWPNPIRERY
ncbi:MAG: YrrC family ATP-dependent DNA helicase [Elusimicrobiota bacterium]